MNNFRVHAASDVSSEQHALSTIRSSDVSRINGRAPYIYIPAVIERSETGVGEAVMGCAVLMFLFVAALAIVCYLL